ncbi:MAG: 30S ribosomal protein S20 [Planctomycetota bacterium]
MPNSRQAAKRMKQDAVRRQNNRALRSQMKTQVKRFFSALESGDVAEAEKELPTTMKRIDKAAKHRVIHPNNAARHKALICRRLNEAKASS